MTYAISHWPILICHLRSSLNSPPRTARRIVLSSRIRAFSFGECFLCSTSIREHANQAVVALVTSSFINLILLLAVLLQLLNSCPGFCPRRRVFDRDLERERICIDSPVAFDQMQILPRILEFISLVKIRDVDNQRVPFPTTTCVSIPLANVTG